jgi:ABC-type lipoprotein export system ATPase subunit
MAIITLKTISKYYLNNGGCVVAGIKDVSAIFSIGEFVAITGVSGSGKTTLLNILAGTDSYSDGNMTVLDENTEYFGDEDWQRYRKEYIGFVYQDYNLLESISVYRNVELAYELNHNAAKNEQKAAINKILTDTGLLPFSKQRVATLSGGQKQRVAIARALAKDTPVILADEPTGNLDSAASEEIIDLLYAIAKNRLVIVVTHSTEQFYGKITREIILENGEIVSDKRLVHSVSNTEELRPRTTEIDNKTVKPKHIRRLVRSGLFSDVKRNISFTITTAIVMLVVLLLGSVFTQFSLPYYEGVINTPVFGTVDRERLILKKDNGEAFTTAEIALLKSNPDYMQVVENDILLDTMFEIKFKHDYGVITNEFYANTVESVKIKNGTLTWGRMPATDDEVIISSDYGEILDEKLRDTKIVSVGTPQKSKSVKIVGGIKDASKYIQTIYFTVAAGKKIAEEFTDSYSDIALINLNSGKTVKERFTVLISEEANAGTVYLPQNLAGGLGIIATEPNVVQPLNIELINPYYEKTAEWENAEIIPTDSGNFLGYNVDGDNKIIIVSRADYLRLLSGDAFQISVFMKKPTAYKSIIDKAEKAGLVAYYPYAINAADTDAENTLTLLWIFIVCLVIGVALVFLSLLLLKKNSLDGIRKKAILLSLGYKLKQVSVAGIIENTVKTAISAIISVLIVVAAILIKRGNGEKLETTFVPYANLPIWFAVIGAVLIGAIYVAYFGMHNRRIGKRKTVNQTLKSGGINL